MKMANEVILDSLGTAGSHLPAGEHPECPESGAWIRVQEGGSPSDPAGLMNLLRNATDAMPRGGRRNIRVTQLEGEGTIWWDARICDSGAGLSEDVLPRIFDPFFSTKPEDKGTGFGLPVSHGIIENHGGDIWAENYPLGGATFGFSLPAQDRRNWNAQAVDRG